MRNLQPFKTNDMIYDNGFRNFYNMIDDFFDNKFTPELALQNGSFKVDIQDNDSEYIVEAELAGYSKDEIKISMEDGKLTISACKNEEVDNSDEKKNYVHKERKVSHMTRSMYFEDADSDKIKAKLQDGVLEINIPKKENIENKKIIDIE